MPRIDTRTYSTKVEARAVWMEDIEHMGIPGNTSLEVRHET
jgi:hypothetical protein